MQVISGLESIFCNSQVLLAANSTLPLIESRIPNLAPNIFSILKGFIQKNQQSKAFAIARRRAQECQCLQWQTEPGSNSSALDPRHRIANEVLKLRMRVGSQIQISELMIQ